MVLIKAITQEEKAIKGIAAVGTVLIRHAHYISFFLHLQDWLKYGECLGLFHIKLSPTYSAVNEYNICSATEFQVRLILFREGSIIAKGNLQPLGISKPKTKLQAKSIRDENRHSSSPSLTPT